MNLVKISPMPTLVYVIVSTILCGLTTSSYAAEQLAKTYPAVGFNKVTVSGNAVIEIEQAESEYLRAEAEADVIERVDVDLSGNHLTLSVKGKNSGIFKWFNDNNEQVRFVLRVKSLSELNLSGSVNATIDSISQDHFKLDASGAGRIYFTQLQGDSTNIHLSGASTVDIQRIDADQQSYRLNGASKIHIQHASKADHVDIEVMGASKMEAKVLSVETAKIEANGASGVDITVSNQLTAKASGASTINYYGKATAKTQSSGASQINARDDE